jgi:hypothetical protein
MSERFLGKAIQVGKLVEEKNAAYGNSFQESGKIMSVLYPNGIEAEQMEDALGVVRILDKLFRVATRKDAFGESPWDDIAGYGIILATKDQENRNGFFENLPDANEYESDYDDLDDEELDEFDNLDLDDEDTGLPSDGPDADSLEQQLDVLRQKFEILTCAPETFPQSVLYKIVMGWNEDEIAEVMNAKIQEAKLEGILNKLRGGKTQDHNEFDLPSDGPDANFSSNRNDWPEEYIKDAANQIAEIEDERVLSELNSLYKNENEKTLFDELIQNRKRVIELITKKGYQSWEMSKEEQVAISELTQKYSLTDEQRAQLDMRDAREEFLSRIRLGVNVPHDISNEEELKEYLLIEKPLPKSYDLLKQNSDYSEEEEQEPVNTNHSDFPDSKVEKGVRGAFGSIYDSREDFDNYIMKVNEAIYGDLLDKEKLAERIKLINYEAIKTSVDNLFEHCFPGKRQIEEGQSGLFGSIYESKENFINYLTKLNEIVLGTLCSEDKINEMLNSTDFDKIKKTVDHYYNSDNSASKLRAKNVNIDEFVELLKTESGEITDQLNESDRDNAVYIQSRNGLNPIHKTFVINKSTTDHDLEREIRENSKKLLEDSNMLLDSLEEIPRRIREEGNENAVSIINEELNRVKSAIKAMRGTTAGEVEIDKERKQESLARLADRIKE